MQTITRETCRLCGGSNLESVLDLGDMAMSDFLDSPDQEVMKAPLELVLCPDCTMVQLRHTAPQELMYSKHYWYKTGINQTICDDLNEIVNVAVEMVSLKPGDVFLDIGTNDGTMLTYVPESMVRVGCEPAVNLFDEMKANCDIAIGDFWSEKVYNKYVKQKAKIITAIGMFYDMEDPNQFVRDVTACLADDGIFVAQLMTLRQMLVNKDIGNVCHEHLEYYSYKSLVKLFEDNGLEIFKVEENKINGGSYRLFGRHLDKGSVKKKEWNHNLKDFAMIVENNKNLTVSFIKQQVYKGRKVYGYGASTKGNTILQYYGLGPEWITAVADKNPEKHGKFTVNGIPIVDEEEARKDADFFFILPYAFLHAFIKREQEWYGKGGKFIVSTPAFRII